MTGTLFFYPITQQSPNCSMWRRKELEPEAVSAWLFM